MVDFRTRVLNVLKGKKPDRLPWFADLSWWMHAHRSSPNPKTRFLGEEGYVNLHKELNTGLYLPLILPYRLTLDCDSKVEKKDDLEIYHYNTPKGTLTEVHRMMPESFTWSYEERLVKSASDLEAFSYYIEAHRFEPAPEEANRLNRLYGELGLPVVWLPRTPLSRFIVEMAGIEATVFSLFEEPEKMQRTFKLMQNKDDDAYNAAAATQCDLVMFPDNLSSEIISPEYFKQYSLDYYKYRIAQLKKAKKVTMAHIDGTLSGLLPILNSSGLDCAEGITPAPVGDVDPEKLRSLTGEGMCLWGGIPGTFFSPAHSEDKFISYAQRYLEVAANDGNMIIGVGDQVPPEGDLDRVRLVSEECESLKL